MLPGDLEEVLVPERRDHFRNNSYFHEKKNILRLNLSKQLKSLYQQFGLTESNSGSRRLNYWRHKILSLNRRVYMIKNCFVSGFYYRKLVGTNFEENMDDNRY